LGSDVARCAAHDHDAQIAAQTNPTVRRAAGRDRGERILHRAQVRVGATVRLARGARDAAETIDERAPRERQFVGVIQQFDAGDRCIDASRGAIVERGDDPPRALAAVRRNAIERKDLDVGEIAQPPRRVGCEAAIPAVLVQQRAPVQQRAADVDGIDRERRVVEALGAIAFGEARAIRHQHVGRRCKRCRESELRLERVQQTERTERDFAERRRRTLRLQAVEM
jgi:hypothetical protein